MTTDNTSANPQTNINTYCIYVINTSDKMLFEKISSDIVAAMKAKDKVRLMALRTVKKYFLEAKTAPGANDELTDEAALKILTKLCKQGKDVAEVYKTQSRADLAEEELAQVAVMEEYLPTHLSEEEVRTEIKTIIDESGATSMKDMKRVMSVATNVLSGRADGKLISGIVKELLS